MLIHRYSSWERSIWIKYLTLGHSGNNAKTSEFLDATFSKRQVLTLRLGIMPFFLFLKEKKELQINSINFQIYEVEMKY